MSLRPRARIHLNNIADNWRTLRACLLYTSIARLDISPAQAETMIEEVSNFLTQQKCKVSKTEYWGLRNLAYPINKQRKGHYALFNIDGPADAIHELERAHRISDDVMRYMTIRVEELDESPSPIVARKDRGDRAPRD